VDNDATLLEVADLVFFDPIGTGFSRAHPPKDRKEYWGLLEDARAMADFIYRWTTDHGRWNSPKYLVGESYGTTRASLVADMLGERHITLNGIVLIAAVLDYQNSRPRSEDGGILSYVSFLPTYAAIARYHGRVDSKGRDLPAFMDEVRQFSRTEYALALIANEHRLTEEQIAHIAGRMSSYIGLSETYIRLSRLRIPPRRFFKELLRDRHMVVGRLDGRYTGTEPDWAGETPESDPTYDAIGGAFTAALHTSLAEFGVQVDRPYIGSDRKMDEAWNWLLTKRAQSGGGSMNAQNGGGYINVVPYLGRAMRRNIDLRVLVASGYYDVATPFFGAENALSQDGVVHNRISYSYYEAGHMIFLHEPSRLQLSIDIRNFITQGAH
jgi:carboxypeptidase C (cathepsin A)